MIREDLIYLLRKSAVTLQFYADLKYSHKMEFPPECQWLAEDMIKEIRKALNEDNSSN